MDRQQLVSEAKKKFEREQLVAAAKNKFAQQSAAVEDKPGTASRVGSSILDGIIYVGEKVDRFAGAPTRQAIGKLQDDFTDVGGAASAAFSQIGERADLAPTGQQLTEKAGIPRTALSEVIPNLYSKTGDGYLKFKRGGFFDPTASGVAGFGIDISADVSNIIPFGAAAKVLGKGVSRAGRVGKAVGGTALDAAKLVTEGAAVAADAVTGTKIATGALETTARVASSVADKAKSAADAIFNIATPKRVANYEKLTETAQSIGISADELTAATEFGRKSVVSRLERTVAEGPTGQKLMDNFENVANKISSGIDDTVTKLGSGRVYEPVAAGDLLKAGYATAERDILKGADLTYKTAADLSPALQIAEKSAKNLSQTIGGLKKRAKGYIARGATKEQVAMGNDLLGFSFRLEKNGTNYRQLSDQIGFIGQAMTDPNLNKVHAKELRSVYKDLSEALIETVTDLSPDLGNQLVDNNKVMSSFFKSRDALGTAIQNAKSNPESLFRSMTGNASQIDELKKILPVDDFNSFRASYLDTLIRRNADGLVLYDSTVKSLKKNAGRLSKMFDAEELVEIGNLLDLGRAQGDIIFNNSGSGISAKFGNIKNYITSSLVNENVVGRMKARGRGLEALNEPAISPASLKEAVTLSDINLGGSGKFALPARGSVESRLKGAQSIAPSFYQDDPEQLVQTAANQKMGSVSATPGAKALRIEGYGEAATETVDPAQVSQLKGMIQTSQLTNSEKALTIYHLEKQGRVSPELLQFLQGGK